MKKMLVLLLALVGVGQVAWASRASILLEDPAVWFAFDTNQGDTPARHHGGANTLTIDNTGTQTFAVNDDFGGQHIVANKEQGLWGQAMPLGDGDWTYVLRAKAVTSANYIMFCLGNANVNKRALVLYTGGNDTIKLGIVESFTNHEATCSFPVSGATTGYHDYAVVYSKGETCVHVYVDGIYKTSMTYTNYLASNSVWQFAALHGGTSNQSTLINGAGVCIDDFRFYRRRLTTDELAALAEGHTQVPVFGGFLGTANQLIWPGIQLKDVYRFRGTMGGGGLTRVLARRYYQTHSATAAAAQYNAWGNETYGKAVKAVFTQTPTGVVAKATYSRYIAAAGGGGVYGVVGNDFDINQQKTANLAMGNEMGGYGIYALTADVLTDGNAAVWSGTDGTLSDAANYTNATALAANGNLSFRSGSGTVQNDFAAGTKFGTLAFGIESGSWNLTGNAATFADVVNASTQAQTIGFPMSYTGDFAPESWGPITFTDLTVGGTFQPIGSGDIRFAGNTSIATADFHKTIRTVKRPAHVSALVSTWTSSAGYYTNNVIPQLNLKTVSVGTTRFGEMIINRRGQSRYNLVLDGNFTIGGTFYQGNNSYVTVTNGTVTFENTYAPTNTMGTYAYFFIFPGAAVVMPSYYPSSARTYFQNKGTLTLGDVYTGSDESYFYGNGTLRATRLAGKLVIDGQTIQPQGDGLSITATTTLTKGNSTVAGVTFLARSPAGDPASITVASAMTTQGVPITITGGGRFTYKSASSYTISSLTVGDNTTADYSAMTSLTVTNLTLGANATLVLPPLASSSKTKFVNTPTLPTDGTATLAIKVPNTLTAGTYTISSSGFTADQLEHLKIALDGPGALNFTATPSVASGALKVTLAQVASVSGEKTATLVAEGYTGVETLTNFPVCVKLPDCVPGFRIADALADGSDVWFADANGNRLAAEKEQWNTTTGEAIFWVKIPALTRASTFTMHWGGTAVTASKAADVWSANYVGVWHMNEASGNAVNSANSSFPAVPKKGSGGNTAQMVGCTGKIGGGRVNASTDQSKGNYYSVASYNSKNVGNTFTISGWCYAQAITGYPRPFSRKNTNGENSGWEIHWNKNAATTMYVRGASTNAVVFKSFTSPVKQWVHYAWVFNGTSVSMYCNGAIVSSGTIKSATDNGRPLSFGCNSNGSEKSFYGNFDEIRLHDALESADWLRAAYDTMATPATFLACTATSIPYANTVTIDADTVGGTYDVSAIAADRVVVTGAAALTLTGTAPDGVKEWDFSAATGAVGVNFSTGAATVKPGTATTFAVAGSGALVIGAGKMARVPAWSGTVFNVGTIAYTMGSQESAAPRQGTTEYASAHIISFTYPTRPIVLSGDVTYTQSRGMMSFIDSPVTVTEGAHVTFANNVDFAEENSVKGRGAYGARFIQQGGLVESNAGYAFNYSGYTGTNRREASITLTGGTFRSPLNFWCTSVTENNERTTIKVGGSTVFAPSSLGWRNATTAHAGAMRGYITLSDTGRFVVPSAHDSLYLLPITVGEGTPMLASPDGEEAYCTAPITLPAARTLTIPAASTIILQGELTGTGTFDVATGGVLDLSEDAFVATNFTGTVHVQTGAVLILPADRVPSYTIALDAGAQVIATVTDLPEDTAKFLGALASVPAEGTATITFDLPVAIPQGSLYTLSTSALDATSASHLALTFVGAAGETTSGTLEISDAGAVQVRISESTAKGALEWKAGRVTSDLAELAWTLYGSDDTTAYPFAANVPLYFTDKGTDTTITFAESVKPSTLTVNAAQDYLFMGSKIDAATVVKDGAGTLTVNNGFTAPNSVTVKKGVLKIGDAAKVNVLGAAGTAVNVEEGATLDLNQRLSSSADADRGAALQNAIVTIKGSGTSGQGAITDASGVYPGAYQYSLGRVVLAGDATIGGTSRIDFRKTGSAYEGGTSLTGPSNATLTVTTHVDESYDCGLNFNSSTVKVGKIVLGEGGMIGAEGATTFDVPNGIEMQNNSRFHYWGATGTKPKIVVTGTGAGLKGSGKSVNQQSGQVVVEDTATLDMRGDTKVNLTGGLANEGAATTSSGQFTYSGSTVINNGTLTVQGGTLELYPKVLTGAGDINVTGGTLRFGSGTTFSDLNQTLKMTSGSTWWYFSPMEASASLDVTGVTAGDLHFRAANDSIVPTFFATAKPAKIFVDVDSFDKPVHIPAGEFNWSTTMLGIGALKWMSALELDDGANVTFNQLSMSDGSTSTNKGQIVINTGATLTVKDWARIGHWACGARHELIVNGGTFNHLDDDNTRIGWDGNYGYLTINAGTVRTRGLTCFRNWRDPATCDAQVVMNGGTLELAETKAGVNAICAWTHFNPFVVFNGGTVKSMNNWNVEQMRSAAFGTEAGGHVDFDLNGKTVDWRTGLQGRADVTLKGEGTFKSGYGSGSKYLFLQGLLTGAWTIENTGANDLSGAAGFLGGLHLAKDVAATVHIAGSNVVEAAYLQTTATSMNTNIGVNVSFPFTCNDLTTMHSYDEETYSKGQFMWQGRFYVDTPGTWTFAGGYDDGFCFRVDGTNIIYTTKHVATIGKIALSQGWHTFWMVQYQNTGHWGCTTDGWKSTMNVGFKKSATTSTASSEYLRFDTQNLPMKPLEKTGFGDYAGLDGTVELDAGATLTNDATADSCPIWGTLKGSGKLVGKFAFVGEKNVYEVTGTGSHSAMVYPDMSGVTTTTANAGLRKVKATFDAKPGCAKYKIGSSLGADASKIALEVKDAAGNDYTENFSLTVESDTLYLKNARPTGLVLFVK